MQRLAAVAASAVLALGLAAGVGHTPTPASADDGIAKLTYYTDRGTMADGNDVYPGAASCSYNFPFGTQIYFPASGVLVTCEDRGAYWYFGYGMPKVDVWSGSGRPWWLTDYMTYEVWRWGW